MLVATAGPKRRENTYMHTQKREREKKKLHETNITKYIFILCFIDS